MTPSRRLTRTVAAVVVAAHLTLGLAPVVQAGMVSAESTLTNTAIPGSATGAATSREQLLQAFSRDEVRAQLQAHGVSAEMARQRVAALSDADAVALAADFESAPAGAGGFLAGLLLIGFFGWAILNITDYGRIFLDDEKPATQ